MNLRLVEKRIEAKGTKSFFWEPEKEVKWLPGQYYYITLPKLNYPDDRGTTRHFSISSSPTEGKLIRITTRIREQSGYKKTLDEMATGAVVEGAGPNGTFVFDENEKGPHVFIAGGIGITPFRSMLKYVADNLFKNDIFLFYSNSVPEEIAFRHDLEGISQKHPNVKLFMTVSHPKESQEKWNGPTGRLDEKAITDALSKWGLDYSKAIWWVCGPPAMSDAMEQVVDKMGVTGDRLRTEKFTGY